MSKKSPPTPAPVIVTSSLLMRVWVDAAAKWRALRSDPAYAACVAARADWYRHVYGAVPPLPSEERPQ